MLILDPIGSRAAYQVLFWKTVNSALSVHLAGRHSKATLEAFKLSDEKVVVLLHSAGDFPAIRQ